MDPNLTLAHITHNTSMILLHQHIAYPPPHWNDLVKLPSSCSAETCQLAAIETSAICQKYLKYTENGIVNSQFALCAFIAGRILLGEPYLLSHILSMTANAKSYASVHWRFCNTDLSPEFFGLLECLYEMSRRWQGQEPLDQQNSSNEKGPSIAAQYAMELESFHASFVNQPQFCMNVLGYSQDSAGRTVDSLLPSIFSPYPTSPDTVQSPSQRHHVANFYNNPMPGTNGSASHPNITHQPARMGGQRYPIETSSPQHTTRTPRTSISNLGNHEWQTLHNSQPVGMPSNMQVPHNTMQPNIDYDSVSVDDELTAMSNTLLGQQFLEMDRVITYDGTNFAIDLDGWPSMN